MMLLDGIHVPLTAPFYRDGSLYLRKLEHNVRRLSLGPASALIALDPRLESMALSDAEAIESLKAVSETAAPEKVLVACVVKQSVRSALELIREAHAAKFDAVALPAPLQRGNDDEVLHYVRAVADASPLPVMLWSDAAAPFFSFSVQMIAMLASHPAIVGVYDADLRLERLAAVREATVGVKREATVTHVFRPVTARMLASKEEAQGPSTFVSAETLAGGSGTSTVLAPAVPAIKTRTRVLGFQILGMGAASEMPGLLRAGAAGAAPLLAGAAPQAVHEAYAAHTDNDPRLSDEKAARLLVADGLMEELGPAAVKYAADLTGFYGGWPRLPILPLDGEDQKRVDRVMAGLRN